MNDVIDLTDFHNTSEESDAFDVWFDVFGNNEVASSSDDFESVAKEIQELEDYELARSLQVSST